MNENLAELKTSVDRLSDEATDIRAQLRSRTRALWVAITVGGILLTVVLAAAVAVTLNNSQRIARNNQKFCPFIGILIPQPGDPQPTTPRGVKVGEDAARVSHDFGCQ